MENDNQKSVSLEEQTNSNPSTKTNPYPIYMLIVSGQTFSKEEKLNVLDRINTGLINIGESLSAVKEELNNAIRSQLFDSYNYDQEYRIVYNEKNLVVEIIINSSVKSYKRALRQLFLSNLTNKYFVNATVDLNTNGDVNLQDSLFSYDDLVELLNDEQIRNNLLNNKESKTTLFFNPRLFELNKNWKLIEKTHKNILFAHSSKASQDSVALFNEFISEMGKFLNETPLEQLMDSSKVIGTLRIQKPILYIFPGREGDSAFFTINGYSMLINGGYDRVKPCFWSFVSMLQQIDSVLITHTDSDALGGLSSFFGKKLVDSDVKPTVLTVLGNLIASKHTHEANGFPNSPKPKTALLAVNLIANDVNESSKKNSSHVDIILESIERLKIKLMPLVKSNDNLMKSNSLSSKYEHINLYYKLGQGSLDLYVLSPFANSTDYKEFVQQQLNHVSKQTHQKSQLNVNQLFKNIPLSHLTSAVVLLVWLPTFSKQNSGENNALRLLFTGNAPQNVVINALDKVKDFEVLSTPVFKSKSNEMHSNGTSNQNSKKPQHSNSNSGLNASANQTNNATHSNGVKASSTQSNKVAVNLANSSSQPTNGNGTTEPSKPVHHNRVSLNNQTANKDKDSVIPPKSTNNETKANSLNNNPNKPPKASNPATSTQVTNGSSNKDQTNNKKQQTSNAHDNSFSKKKVSNGTANGKEEHTTDEKATDKKPVSAKPNGTASAASNKKTDTTDQKLKSETNPTSSVAATTNAATTKPSIPKSEPKTNKVPAKPAASKPAPAPTQVKEQPTKKPLSIEVSNKKSGSNKAPEQAKKEPSVESRIITKRDPKPPVKPVEPVEPAVVTETTTEVTNEINSEVNVAAVPSETIENVPVQEQVPEHVKEQVQEQVQEHVQEHVQELVQELVQDQVREQVQEEIKNEENDDASEEIITEQVINIELISSNLEHSNEIIKENLTSENSNSAETVQMTDYSEWPNLSPVKKDQNGASAGGDYLDENGNNSIDDGNESGLHNGAVKPIELNFQNGGNLIADAADLIVSPKDENNLFATNQFEQKTDIMTRSFIDDGLNSNPFMSAAKTHQKVLDDSENDLNKTHELTDEENSELVKNDEQNGHSCADQLIESIQSLTIESKNGLVAENENGFSDHVEYLKEAKVNDPATWNLLELPKPINPNDLPAAPLINNSNGNDKKLTPNGKKMNPSSLSPSNGATTSANASENSTTVKTMNKHQTNNHVNKSLKPVTPVYVEVSYIPAHGSSYYVDADFFRKVRARHYILSTEEPNEHVLNSLIEAKETWEEKNSQVSIIPTYESEVMRRWFETNEENLARLKIDVMPAANFATVTMDDNPDLSCQVFKLEF